VTVTFGPASHIVSRCPSLAYIALAHYRPHTPDIAADHWQRRVEAGADDKVRDQSVKQVVRFLHAPKLRLDGVWTVLEYPV
jgi:hypothetical protein